MERAIYTIGMWASRKSIIKSFGKQFYIDFRLKSKDYLNVIIPQTPDIGKSAFKFNFQFTPSYIAWYKALKDMGLDQDTTIKWIWTLNENMFCLVPKWLMKRYGAKVYLGGFRKKAAEHEKRSEQNAVHEFDYKIHFRDVDENTFEIDFYQCGMKKLCEQFDALGLFPGICRIDYLISHYVGCGFYRTKTLGDGVEVCNCGYMMEGTCEWNPEKGFVDRK